MRSACPRARKKRTLLAATRRTGSLVSGAALSAATDSPDHLQAPKVVGAKPRADGRRERSECKTCDAGDEGDSARGARLACVASLNENADAARRLPQRTNDSKRRDAPASKQSVRPAAARDESQSRPNETEDWRAASDQSRVTYEEA
jgi:hypothetical protein